MSERGAATREFNRASAPVAAAALATTVFNASLFATIAFSIGVQPLTRELHWGFGTTSGAISVMTWGMAVSALFAGPLITRFGPRRIAIVSVGLTGPLLAAIALVGPRGLALFYGLHAALGLLTPGVGAVSTIIADWFDRRRALALSVTGIGVSIAATIFPWLANELQSAMGWRAVYGIFGLLVICVPLPLAVIFLHTAGGREGSFAPMDPVASPKPRLPRAAAKGWLLVPAQGLAIFAGQGFRLHAVGMVSNHGLPPQIGVQVLMLVSAGMLVGQVGIGTLLDRYQTPRVILPFAALAVAGLLLLRGVSTPWAIYAGSLLFGLGEGGENGVTSYLLTRYFGLSAFPRIYGIVFPALMVIGAPGPLFVGVIRDRTGSYDGAFLMIEVALLISLGLFALLGSYPPAVSERTSHGSSGDGSTIGGFHHDG